jgi:hypothetical protein
MKTGTKAARRDEVIIATITAERRAQRSPFGRLFVAGVCLRSATEDEAKTFNDTGVLVVEGQRADVRF